MHSENTTVKMAKERDKDEIFIRYFKNTSYSSVAIKYKWLRSTILKWSSSTFPVLSRI